MKRVISIVIVTIMALALFASFPGITFAAAPMPGAIWTTDSTGTVVNQNIYDYKTDVYLNGGPKSSGSPGLPDGYYYVKVTAPNGQILGSSVGGSYGAVTTVQVINGRFIQIYQLWTIVRSASSEFENQGYNDTPNPGNEYKVWLSQDPDFANSSSKTDNFKVLHECPCECPVYNEISARGQNKNSEDSERGEAIGKETAPGQNKVSEGITNISGAKKDAAPGQNKGLGAPASGNGGGKDKAPGQNK